ncbi:MAG: ester cyclase [Actinomycetota bacterium]|jgi:steroid delta-isomerase-like uncharacterized protein|nr:ester cyclase [Actinomycetota bacterium]MDQ3355131.1 ester cyclase [Actinomycetota bacterium]
MARDENIAAQEKLGEGINAGNLDVIHEVFAPDVVDHDPAPDQGPGPDGFRHFFETMTTAFPDLQVTVDHLVADDENVCIAYQISGTHNGEFLGVAGTGKPVQARAVQIARFRDGQIVERWGSTDALTILQQVGATPAG